MCHPPGARPPDVPRGLLPISGGAGGEDVILTSEDATRFRARLAKAGEGDSGVVIAPDVRGLHPFYEELAERFAIFTVPSTVVIGTDGVAANVNYGFAGADKLRKQLAAAS